MAKTLNLFITDSIFQYFIADYMRKTLSEFKTADNILFNVSSNVKVKSAPDLWSKMLQRPLPAWRKGNSFFLLKQVKVNLREIQRLVAPYTEVHIFMSTLYKFQNIVFNTFVKNAPNIKYFNYPDGNNSLFLIKASPKERLLLVGKSILAKLAGVRYGAFPFYVQDKVGLLAADKIYSCLPAQVNFFPGEVVDIGLPKIALEYKADRLCLFCGMPLEQGMHKEWQKKLEETAAFIAARHRDLVLLYKPHPREEVSLTYPFFAKYGFQLWQAGKYPDTNLEEAIFNGFSPQVIYSWWSSVLINAKLMLGDQVDCVAYKGVEFFELEHAEGLAVRKLYQQLGIKYIP